MSSSFEIFDNYCNSRDVRQLLSNYSKLNECLLLNENIQNFQYFLKLKKLLQKSKQILKFNKISNILLKLEKRSQLKCYQQNRPLIGQRVLVIGGGISGLRVAIELLLLGANVICVEKRDNFSRNNVIHLWPNVISDLRLLAAKRFYGRFCVGSIDHISIREIQLILLKIALIFGLKFFPNVTFDKLCPKLMTTHEKCQQNSCHCCCHSHGFGGGAVCHFENSLTSQPFTQLNDNSFDIIVGADGRRNTLFQDFPRKEFRGKLAIAITANFVNKRTEAEVRVAEISGVSYIYAQKWFKELFLETGCQLENVCYYRDETHYFVMTATKQSLIKRRVLIRDLNETHLLLSEDNIDRKQLLLYARDAAQWTSGLRDLEFSLNACQSADVALFDFTSVYASRNASRAKRVKLNCCQSKENEFKDVLMLLTGDSLLEPFWPTGSGAGRGFLSALDAAFCCLQWTEKVVKYEDSDDNDRDDRMLDVIAERESIYRLLAQTTPENVNSKEFSLLPNVRYKNWRQNSKFEIKDQIRHLIGCHSSDQKDQLAAKRARRATVAVTARDLSSIVVSKDSEELELLLIRKELNEKRLLSENNSVLNQKASWLLGSALGHHSGPEDNKEVKERPKREKKECIIERAQQLEQILSEGNQFEIKLEKVGKIEENDWNFRVWEKNEKFNQDNSKGKEEKRVLENSKQILDSRKQQILEKMNSKSKEEKKSSKESKEWIQKMSEELTQRMKTDSGNDFQREEKKKVIEEVSVPSMPKCVRCGLQVSLMDRISVCGDVLHRSCLRCSKCGISLRLNEFRNELKFLCIYCLKNNSEKSIDWMKAKENFLRENQKIDFRERIEFENKKEDKDNSLEILNKKAINSEQNSDSDTELTFDLSSSQDDDSDSEDDISDDSDDWETTSDDESEKQKKAEERREETPPIPSICVTRDDNRTPVVVDANDNSVVHHSSSIVLPRYQGQFTEKLFRSKSQPMLAHRMKLKVFNKENISLVDDNDDDRSDDDFLPFADCGIGSGLLEQHFSPVRALKAPIFEFKDI